MIRTKKFLTVAATALSVLGLAACGSSSEQAEGGRSEKVEVVTHTAVGGGADVFSRQMVKVLYDNKIIPTQWPVRNVPAGNAIGAMSFLIDRAGDPDLLAQVTPTWLATPMTVAKSSVNLDQLTPIALVATEPQVVVTKAGGKFGSFADFVDAAKAAPDTLVQAGGSSTANDALTRSVLQETVDAKWKFLSFEDTGSRITALLRDDADIMLGSASDVAEQVRAGQLSVLAVVGNKRLDIFPEVQTIEEQGIDSSQVPVQFRAIMGTPDMPEDAVEGYQDDLSKMVETEAWKTLATNDGLVTQNLQGAEFSDYLADQKEIIGNLLGELGLRKDQ
ncbi:Bug family tripartite tricarboxylate transporter substrate binding protein [Mycolicibacterium mengxianglii]|uniref:Bug family tripartite tricarboxylate transporter substrate binding protein n=1 Tax=Mycolicibacterium mengxianglii TaxID=2736649 RepID=UPI0018D16E50|nr:tripartite tricarboxylate transporter substrate-binding protein [Mycolicibacterium mengxianglii]